MVQALADRSTVDRPAPGDAGRRLR